MYCTTQSWRFKEFQSGCITTIIHNMYIHYNSRSTFLHKIAKSPVIYTLLLYYFLQHTTANLRVILVKLLKCVSISGRRLSGCCYTSKRWPHIDCKIAGCVSAVGNCFETQIKKWILAIIIKWLVVMWKWSRFIFLMLKNKKVNGYSCYYNHYSR